MALGHDTAICCPGDVIPDAQTGIRLDGSPNYFFAFTSRIVPMMAKRIFAAQAARRGGSLSE